MAKKRTASDSMAQREAETVARTILGNQLRLRGKLQPEKFALGKSKVAIDGVYRDDDRKCIVLAEIYSRIGELKAAQKNKVLADVLKLALVEKAKGEEWVGFKVTKIIAFADHRAKKYLEGKSWGAEVADIFGVQTRLVELPVETAAAVKAAQRNQDLRMADPV
jgi:hypothetical protein